MKAPKISIGTIVRAVLLVIASANQILVNLGLPIIPIDTETVSDDAIATGLLIITAIWAYWKDNDVTIKARWRKLVGKNETEKQ